MPARMPSAVTVYIVRHAHAVRGRDDDARPLSKQGREQIRRMGKFLRKHRLVTAREFWHSPLVRSRDTAKRLIKQLRSTARLVETEGLRHGDPPSLVARRLARERHPVAVVGHEPHLGALLSLLLTGAAHPVRYELQKAAVVALTRNRGRWLVQWHLAPEVLAKK